MKITKLFRKKRKKKGVSPIIAVVLMVAVTVTILVIVYAWTTGFASEKAGIDTLEAEYVILESQRINSGHLIINLRNSGNNNAVIDSLYVEGRWYHSELSYYIPQGKSLEIIIPMSCHNILIGTHVMLVTERGTQIRFTVRG